MSQVKEFSTFLRVGRCLGSRKSLPWQALQQSQASVLCAHTLSFVRAHRREWLRAGGRLVTGAVLPEFPPAHQLAMLGGCNRWWLWHPCLLIRQEIIPFCSLSAVFIWSCSFIYDLLGRLLSLSKFRFPWVQCKCCALHLCPRLLRDVIEITNLYKCLEKSIKM